MWETVHALLDTDGSWLILGGLFVVMMGHFDRHGYDDRGTARWAVVAFANRRKTSPRATACPALMPPRRQFPPAAPRAEANNHG